MVTEQAQDPAVQPATTQTLAELSVCRHCGARLNVPEHLLNGDAQALEEFVGSCSDDCENTKAGADRLDDYTFEKWADSHLDRISAAMEGRDIAAIPPPDVSCQRLEAHELFHRANWVHHGPAWIDQRRESIEEDLASLAWRGPWWDWRRFDPMVKRAIWIGVLSGIAVALMKSCSLI
ncbi:MAG: hypothetical protein IT512_11005 [Rhodocyclaceae bacterium]|nr:hypothetical protein [Rhodocyclaceae bacterium]